MQKYGYISTVNISTAERRQIENEMIFRRMNEQVGDDLGALDAMHIEDNNTHLIRDANSLIHFKCECSDENCDARIAIKLEEYQNAHQNRSNFIVKPNHQVESIETIVSSQARYSIVKKNNSTPEPGKDLNDTIINNM